MPASGALLRQDLHLVALMLLMSHSELSEGVEQVPPNTSQACSLVQPMQIRGGMHVVL